MNELRVVFTPASGGSFDVRLESAPGRTVGAPATLTPFLTDDDYENLRWYLEEYMDLPDGGAVIRAQRHRAAICTSGAAGCTTPSSPPPKTAHSSSNCSKPGTAQLTIATDQSALLRLPWELLADDAGSLAQRVSVRRQLETPETTEPREVQLPLRMLYIVSRPSDTGFIDPRHDDEVAVRRARSARRQRAARFLPAAHPGSHGGDAPRRRRPRASRTTSCISTDTARSCPRPRSARCASRSPTTARAIRRPTSCAPIGWATCWLKYQVPLVVLEACRSATVGKTAVFRSVAPRLIQAGVGSVLSMGHAVHVEAARVSARPLLPRAGRAARRIGQAVAEGRCGARRRHAARWIEYGPRGRTDRAGGLVPAASLPTRCRTNRSLPPDAARPAAGAAVRPLPQPQSQRLRPRRGAGPRARRTSTACGSGWTSGSAAPASWSRSARRAFATAASPSSSARSARSTRNGSRGRSTSTSSSIQRRTGCCRSNSSRSSSRRQLDDLLWVDFTDPAEGRGERGAARTAASGRPMPRTRAAGAGSVRRRRAASPAAFPRPPQYRLPGTGARTLRSRARVPPSTAASCCTRWAAWARRRSPPRPRTGGRAAVCFATAPASSASSSSPTPTACVQVSSANYCEGPRFHQRPAAEQRHRAIELFRDRVTC